MSDIDSYRDLINHQESNSGDELSDFLRKSAQAQLPASQNKEAIWDKISEATGEDQGSRGKNIRLWQLVGIAASIAIIATFAVLFKAQPEQIEITTGTGESITEILPDGSQVMLNSASFISYSSEWNREIKLQGEAFFEVTEGKKFTVKTSLGEVEVLGTSFNVFARDGDFEVLCKTGKVRVSIPDRVEELVPGQAMTVDADTVKIVHRLPESIGTWRSGEFYYEEKLITEVFEEFERQFGVEIEFDSGSNGLRYTGYFHNDKTPEIALDEVCAVMGLSYSRTGQNKYTISENTQ